MTEPILKAVETLYESNYRSIPAMLRESAESIESEEAEGYSPTVAMVAVQIAANGKVQVYGWGDTDAMHSIAMLERAKAAIMQSFEEDVCP